MASYFAASACSWFPPVNRPIHYSNMSSAAVASRTTTLEQLPRVRPPNEKLPRADLIFNPVSGCGDADLQLETIRVLLGRGYEDVKVHTTTAEVGAEELARKALQDGAQVVVASGGDGTVASVAKAIRERPSNSPSARLGVIPRGTANALCAALGIPSDIERAAALVNRASARKMDMADVNDSGAMLMQCGIGLEAGTVKLADRNFKDSFGQFAYHLAALASLRSQETFTVDATLYGVRQERPVGDAYIESDRLRVTNLKAKAVTVANASPPSSVLAHGIGEVDCSDGLLEFICVSPRGPGSVIRAVVSMFKAAIFRAKVTRSNVYGMRARRIEISCDPPQCVVVDGEEIGNTPITIELARDEERRQIEIIAPKAKSVTKRRRRFGRMLTRLWRNAQGFATMVLGLYFVRVLRVRRLR